MAEQFGIGGGPPAQLEALRPAETDALDETVVHDPQGRPWLVYTADLSLADGGGTPAVEGGRYESQVYYTARAGIRGLPTGHGERYVERAEAIAGHRSWCVRVRHGQVFPDLPPAPCGPAAESPR